MKVLIYLSNCILPLLLFYIILYGIGKKVPVFDVFLRGAREGVKTAASLLPALVGLYVGIHVLRASGFLDWIASLFARAAALAGIRQEVLPAQLWPLILCRPFSASAATGLALDLFQSYGPDSLTGIAASLILSCSETIIYTMSVYYGAVKITKTRYTLAGGLIACAAGTAASIVLAHMMQ